MMYRDFEKTMQRLASDIETPKKADSLILFKHANGYQLTDYNDTQYIDMINGKGAVLLGHNNPVVNEAIASLLQEKSNILTGPNELIAKAAEFICGAVGIPDAKITFFTTGTAACRAAAQASRKKTKKQMIVSAGYHGWDPMWRGTSQILEPNHDGVVDFFFMPELLEMFLSENSEKVALCMISPDYIHINQHTLNELIDIADRYNVLTCLDDVKQGFRYRAGASFEMVSTRKFDMYTFSKGLANGNRLSCLVGNPEVMNEARGFTYTSYFDMIPISASLATLNFMKENNGYAHIAEIGKKIYKHITALFNESLLPAAIYGDGPMLQFVFGDPALSQAFYQQTTQQGLLLFENDNQSISFCYDDMAVTEIVRIISNILDGFTHTFRHLLGKPLTNEDVFKTGWCMIDGAADVGTYDEKISWIKELL